MPRSTPLPSAAPTPFDAAATRPRRTAPLCDLDIAPENLRAGEPPDDDVPLLADTLFAAGQLQPLTVRPGRRGERPFMALDGRRRLLALRLLADEGRVPGDLPVEVRVETDAARQAAAVVLTNTAAPVHVADVIAAIGRMVRGRLGMPGIARALGYAEIEVKRLAALSALPAVALEALRAGRLTLRQARLLARLPSVEEQAELAQAALEGRGFADWRVTEQLDGAQVLASDPRCALVPPAAYTAAGGRIEADLFDERPPVLLDASVLTDLWITRAQGLAAVFQAEGLTVHLAAVEDPVLPDDLERPGYVYGGALPADAMRRYREAQSAHEAAAEAARVQLADGTGAPEEDAAVVDLIRVCLVRDQIALEGRAVTTLVLAPARGIGVRVTCWTPVETAVGREAEEDPAEAPAGAAPAAFEAPRAEAPAPDIEGVGHSLHRLRTEVATRGLARALADDPRTAMTALIAELFQVVTGRGWRAAGALTVTAQAFAPRDGRVIEALDGGVRRRLDDRRAAWEASGLTLIGWVHGLQEADRAALLAELTALTLDLTEARTSAIRSEARAEAAELAALANAEVSRHWTPDAVFLAAHPKSLLLGMLAQMGKAPPAGAGMAKSDLVALVEATAAARGWAPPALSWTPATADGEDGSPEPDGAGRPGRGFEGEDGSAALATGAGAFEVTAAGEAALASGPSDGGPGEEGKGGGGMRRRRGDRLPPRLADQGD